MQGKTVIAIAHRLSTIAAMDRLVILESGKMIESGSHDQLLKQGGLYSELWARQSGGFILGEEEITAAVPPISSPHPTPSIHPDSEAR